MFFVALEGDKIDESGLFNQFKSAANKNLLNYLKFCVNYSSLADTLIMIQD
jgi:hypothetical protein